ATGRRSDTADPIPRSRAAGTRTDRVRSGPPAGCRRDAGTRAACERSLLLLGSVGQLPVVLGLVIGAVRLGDEAVATERPLLEAGAPHRLSGPARPRVGSGEGPVVLDALVLEDDVVHEHPDVGKGGHERPRHLRDVRGLGPVDCDRATWCVVARDPRGIVAA